MQKLKHNKKRNVGLLYEFFARYIGKAIIDGCDNDLSKAKLLLKKHFNRSTDTYKELKLFKALSESHVSNREQALHLIDRVREAVKFQSQARLDLERTGLIHEINSSLNSNLFFEQTISSYKKLATIQVLLNTWRDSSLKEAVSETVDLEERLIEFMLENKKVEEQETLSMTTEDVDRLVVNIMAEKVNKKYANLTLEQKDVIRLFVFSKDSLEVQTQLTEKLQVIKNRFSKTLASHQHEFSTDAILVEKLQKVNSLLQNDYSDTSFLSEDLVSFYLGISKMEEELKTK